MKKKKGGNTQNYSALKRKMIKWVQLVLVFKIVTKEEKKKDCKEKEV